MEDLQTKIGSTKWLFLIFEVVRRRSSLALEIGKYLVGHFCPLKFTYLVGEIVTIIQVSFI